MPDQLSQISTMNNVIDNSNTHDGILDNIYSGKYLDEYTDAGSINKCNIFTDDMLKKYHGITLPRRGDFSERARKVSSTVPYSLSEGLGDPGSAVSLGFFFDDASKYPTSGISKLDPQSAVSLSQKGFPVVVSGHGHSSLLAPSNDDSIQMYSPNYVKHEGKKEPGIIGVKDPNSFGYYHIDNNKYSNFLNTLRQNKIPLDKMTYGNELTPKQQELLESLKGITNE
jgi:hypothetical protein